MKRNEEPLYKTIYDDIKSKIMSREYMPGDKILTELEIAEQYSVSRITATRAVKELEQSGFIQRARKRGSIVNPPDLYHPGNGAGIYISMVLPFEMSNCIEIFDGAQSGAITNSYAITAHNSSHDPRAEHEIIQNLLTMDTAGFIVWPVGAYDNLDIFSEILARKKPLVFIDFPKMGIPAPCVSSDNVKAMFDITSHVISKGHKNIAFCGNSVSRRPSEAQRFEGFAKAMIHHGLIVRDEYVVESGYKLDTSTVNKSFEGSGYRTEDKAKNVLNYLMSLKTPPTALVCINDIYAVHIEKEALNMNISVPGQLSITGFDNSDTCNFLNVPLTSVEQEYRSIGRKAADLIRQIGGGEGFEPNYYFDTKIVERDSVADLNR